MTAKAAHSRLLLLAGIAILAGSGPGRAQASDLELHPSLSVSEEYNDNIFETAAVPKTDYVTRVQPGAVLHYKAPSLSLDSLYAFEYRNYAKRSHDDELIHSADLKGSAQLVDNFLYLEIGDVLHRATVNVARNLASESPLAPQTTQNIATLASYLLWHPTTKGTLKTGYRYTDIRYWEGAGNDKREHGAFADLEHQVSARFNLSAEYAFTRGETALTGYDRHDLSGGFRYAYADNSSLFCSIGNSWQSFSFGTRTSNLFWNAGVNHDLGVAVARLETRVQNTEDPLSVSTRQVSYTGRLDKAFERGTVGFGAGYAEYFIIETGKLEQRRSDVTATGRYEILPRLTGSASAALERFSQTTPADYPYRLTASGGLTYGFHSNDTALSLAYTYLNERNAIDSANGELVTNRLLLEVRSTF